MKRCPDSCPIIVGSEDKYCYKCGIELVEVDKCSCGANIYKTYKFCPKCGKKR